MRNSLLFLNVLSSICVSEAFEIGKFFSFGERFVGTLSLP